MEDSKYCVLCQEDHVMTAKCIILNGKCKACGLRGHLRKDCSARGLGREKEWQRLSKHHSPVRKAVKLIPVYDHDTVAEVNYGSFVNSCNDDLLNTATRVKQDGHRQELYEYHEFHEEKSMKIFKQLEGAIYQTKKSEYDSNITSEATVKKEKACNTYVANVKKEKGNNVNEHYEEGLINKSEDLDPGKYNIVSVHMEIFRSNKHSWTNLTQIGCVVHGSADDPFFKSIKPRGLEEYLDCYKLGGDLLQALHMTREDDGTFLFRTRFESVEMLNKVVSVDEGDALRSLVSYLRKYPNCVLIGVDEDTISILMDKIRIIDEKMPNIVGFTHWKRVLKYLDVDNYKKVDLEDYCRGDLASYNSALDIAKLLIKSVDEISSKEKDGRKSMARGFYKLCKKIGILNKPLQHMGERNQSIENIEVYSSFSPNMFAIISAEKLSQVIVSSESESEEEESEEVLVDRASVNNSHTIQNPSAKYWEIGNFMHGGPGIYCPECKSLGKADQVKNHIQRAHPKILSSSLLCPKCNKPALPSEIRGHMPACILGPSTPTTGTSWKIMEMKTGPGVVCPWCKRSKRSIRKGIYRNNSITNLGNICVHIANKHSREVDTSLLCPSCNKEVLPSQLRHHIPCNILPGMIVAKRYPGSSNNLRIELESFITTYYCPSPGQYVKHLRMFEHYQRIMVEWRKSVMVSPVVFSTMVPRLCREKWGIEVQDKRFKSRFMGIMLM